MLGILSVADYNSCKMDVVVPIFILGYRMIFQSYISVSASWHATSATATEMIEIYKVASKNRSAPPPQPKRVFWRDPLSEYTAAIFEFSF